MGVRKSSASALWEKREPNCICVASWNSGEAPFLPTSELQLHWRSAESAVSLHHEPSSRFRNAPKLINSLAKMFGNKKHLHLFMRDYDWWEKNQLNQSHHGNFIEMKLENTRRLRREHVVGWLASEPHVSNLTFSRLIFPIHNNAVKHDWMNAVNGENVLSNIFPTIWESKSHFVCFCHACLFVLLFTLFRVKNYHLLCVKILKSGPTNHDTVKVMYMLYEDEELKLLTCPCMTGWCARPHAIGWLYTCMNKQG